MSSEDDAPTQVRFEAEVIHWRGPSPFFFATVPADHASEIRRISRAITYGWGMIPVEARIGDVAFRTSLFPKDQTYLLPLKAEIRRKSAFTAGDTIRVQIDIRPNANSAP
jgi:hypothetical protein